MVKPLSNDIKVIDRVTAVKSLGSEEQKRNNTTESSAFIKGHVYTAKILDVAANGEIKVSIEGRQLMLSMQHHWTIGETLNLRYTGNASGLSFELIPFENNTAQVLLSPTAKDITQKVNSARREGVGNIYQAMIPATDKPAHVQQFAADLQHAMESTGLFYESHLADFMQGSRTLSSLMLEPQNQGGQVLHHLMAQQLHVLETQRVAWHGEIWPGQLADWQVEVEDKPHMDTRLPPETAVNSQVNLRLPHLGNVTANIQLVGNALTLSLVVDELQSGDLLKSHSAGLVDSFKSHALKLKSFSIAQGSRDE